MQFGGYTTVDISPQVGYNFTNNFNAGAGISYSYFKDSWNTVGGESFKEKRTYFGVNVYGRYTALNFLVLSLQPEIKRMNRKVTPSDINESKIVPGVLVGASLRLGPVYAGVFYDRSIKLGLCTAGKVVKGSTSVGSGGTGGGPRHT